MKKTVVILLAVVMALGVLSGCQSASTSVAPSGSEIGSVRLALTPREKRLALSFMAKKMRWEQQFMRQLTMQQRP